MPGHLLLPSEPLQLPLLPLRDVVVFPHMVIPLFVGRPKSIKALEAAMETGKNVLLVAQKTAAKDEPIIEDLYEVGCIANILQMLKLPDGTVKVLVEGTSKRSEEHLCGRNGQNAMVVFPRQNFEKGQYVMVKITDCTSATLMGEAVSLS